MKLNPIIPIGLMVVISITLICVTIFVNLKSKKNKKISILLRIIAILLLFTINLRPMVYVGEEEIVLNDLDVLLVVDTSISMSGKDMESGRKSRLEKVKEDATQIINSLAGSRFALITFDNYGKIMIPFTSDARSVLDAVDALNVKDYYMANPSNPSFALTSMNEVLQRNGDNRQRVVFFFSDGEPTDGKNVESFSGLNKFINNGAVLGYGTKQGSKLYYSPNYNVNEVRVIKDPTNNYADAVTYIYEDVLQNIANQMGLDYYNMSNDKSRLESKVAQIVSAKENGVEATGTKKLYGDIYYYFALALAVILLFDFVLYLRGTYGK